MGRTGHFFGFAKGKGQTDFSLAFIYAGTDRLYTDTSA
jgi:hypothetical protein